VVVKGVQDLVVQVVVVLRLSLMVVVTLEVLPINLDRMEVSPL
jgi:hypothetical protein